MCRARSWISLILMIPSKSQSPWLQDLFYLSEEDFICFLFPSRWVVVDSCPNISLYSDNSSQILDWFMSSSKVIWTPELSSAFLLRSPPASISGDRAVGVTSSLSACPDVKSPAARSVLVQLLKAKLKLELKKKKKRRIFKHLYSRGVLVYLRKLLRENGGWTEEAKDNKRKKI